MIHQEKITSRPRNDIVQNAIPFGGHILCPLVPDITASVADENARPPRISEG